MIATDEAPGAARRVVEDFIVGAGWQRDSWLTDVLLCVSEAVTNVVFHAYRERSAPGEVQIDGSIESDLHLAVTDSGGGFAPRPDSPGMGLGLPVIGNLTQSLDIRSVTSGGTTVIMQFALPPR